VEAQLRGSGECRRGRAAICERRAGGAAGEGGLEEWRDSYHRISDRSGTSPERPTRPRHHAECLAIRCLPRVPRRLNILITI